MAFEGAPPRSEQISAKIAFLANKSIIQFTFGRISNGFTSVLGKLRYVRISRNIFLVFLKYTTSLAGLSLSVYAVATTTLTGTESFQHYIVKETSQPL